MQLFGPIPKLSVGDGPDRLDERNNKKAEARRTRRRKRVTQQVRSKRIAPGDTHARPETSKASSATRAVGTGRVLGPQQPMTAKR